MAAPDRRPPVSRGRLARMEFVAIMLTVSAAWTASAQTEVIITEDTQPLPLVRFPVSGPSGPGTLFLVDFEFGTFEQPSAGELHDSLTLSLTGFSDGQERWLATVDVFGIAVPPLVEGSGNFTGSPIVVRERLAGSILGLAWAHEGAYTLSFIMPGGWSGSGELTGFLASNGDESKSAGLLVQPSLVPEPGIIAMTLAGGVLLLGAGRLRKGGNS